MSSLGIFLIGMFSWVATIALGAWIIDGPPPGLTYDSWQFNASLGLSVLGFGILTAKAMGGDFFPPKEKKNDR